MKVNATLAAFNQFTADGRMLDGNGQWTAAGPLPINYSHGFDTHIVGVFHRVDYGIHRITAAGAIRDAEPFGCRCLTEAAAGIRAGTLFCEIGFSRAESQLVRGGRFFTAGYIAYVRLAPGPPPWGVCIITETIGEEPTP